MHEKKRDFMKKIDVTHFDNAIHLLVYKKGEKSFINNEYPDGFHIVSLSSFMAYFRCVIDRFSRLNAITEVEVMSLS